MTTNTLGTKKSQPLSDEHKNKRQQRQKQKERVSEEFSNSAFRREIDAAENGDTIRRLFLDQLEISRGVQTEALKYSEEEKKKMLDAISSKLINRVKQQHVQSIVSTPEQIEGTFTIIDPSLLPATVDATSKVEQIPQQQPTKQVRKKPWEK